MTTDRRLAKPPRLLLPPASRLLSPLGHFPLRYAIATFGCRVNQADSLQLEMRLRAGGGTRAPLDEADLVVVNTCSVTATADHGARQTLRRVARLNPDARVIATGCYATRSGEEIAALPGSPDVVPNDEKDTLIDRLLPLLPSPAEAETTAERFGDGAGACGAVVSPGVVGRVAFMLRVQTGCDEPCAYCIIPSTRGRGRSLDVGACARRRQPRCRLRVSGGRADRCPPWIVWARPRD